MRARRARAAYRRAPTTRPAVEGFAGAAPTITSRRRVSRSAMTRLHVAQERAAAQRGQAPSGLALDRAHRAVEGIGHLGLREVLEVPQHQHRPLPTRQSRQSHLQVATLDEAIHLTLVTHLRQPLGDHLRVPAPPPPGDVRGHHHLAHIRVVRASARRGDAPPAWPTLAERGLDEVLSLLVVAGQQPRRPQQVAAPSGDVVVEARRECERLHRDHPARCRAHTREMQPGPTQGCHRCAGSGARFTSSYRRVHTRAGGASFTACRPRRL
jgi:hypothetical protein